VGSKRTHKREPAVPYNEEKSRTTTKNQKTQAKRTVQRKKSGSGTELLRTTNKNPKTQAMRAVQRKKMPCGAKKPGIGAELLGRTNKNPKTPVESQ
jgi:hypothetical protein